jgi:hypothetical protein
MKKKFCCDASRGMYEDYYMRQSGSGSDMPVFVGARYQRGHGLGSILSGLFRHVLPFLKANAKNFATNLLRTGVTVAEDVFDGNKKLSESLKERVPQGIKRTINDLEFQSGSGSRKRRKIVQNRTRDIFSEDGFRPRAIL